MTQYEVIDKLEVIKKLLPDTWLGMRLEQEINELVVRILRENINSEPAEPKT